MLGIEHGFVGPLGRQRDAVVDHIDILVEANAQREFHMEIPGLADQTDHAGAAAENCCQPGIVLSAAAGAPRHAKRGQAGAFQGGLVGEECVIGRVGAGPAAFHIVDTDTVELKRDRRLVGGGEIHPLRLRPVAQGRIVNIDALFRHRPMPASRSCQRVHLPRRCRWPQARHADGPLRQIPLPRGLPPGAGSDR